jgi:transposase
MIGEPLLPPESPKPTGGRPRVPDRAALTGLIFVLRSGIPWEMLPQAVGCGLGVTCWRPRNWQDAGVWDRLHRTPIDRLGNGGRIKVRIAHKGPESSERLGRHRGVIERTLAWLNRYRRLTIRYERRVDIHQAFLPLGCLSFASITYPFQRGYDRRSNHCGDGKIQAPCFLRITVKNLRLRNLRRFLANVHHLASTSIP